MMIGFLSVLLTLLALYVEITSVNGDCLSTDCRDQFGCAHASATTNDVNDDICCDGYFGCFDGSHTHSLQATPIWDSADISCGGYYGCGILAEVESTGGSVICFGDRSCYDTTRIGGWNGVTCSALFSCGDDSSTDGDSVIFSSYGNIQCTGPYSCYSRDSLSATYSIFCEGSNSCQNVASISAAAAHGGGDIYCRGFYSCHSSGLETTGVVYCVGEFSCQSSSSITSTANSIVCSADNSCSDGGSITSNTGSVSCTGSSSCRNADNILASSGNVICEGSYSCSNVHYIHSGLSMFCRAFYSCYFSSIIVSSGNLWCVGEFGCQSSYIAVADNVVIYCEGQYACRHASLSPGDHVYCTAEQSCYNANINDPPSNIYCSARISCAYSTIDENVGIVYCSGPYSCFGATIVGGIVIRRRELLSLSSRELMQTSNPSVVVQGYYGAGDATFVVPADGAADFHFSGESAGDGATVQCGDGATCNIYCSGNGCEGLTVECDDAECVVECDPSTNIDCPTITGCQSTLNCPSECSSDPCPCDEVQNCRDGLCHANGCDQCEDGYFKKDYNYHCAQCQEVFGDDCMHCTDFLGCQQCQTGTRTYDSDCGLYYCQDPEC